MMQVGDWGREEIGDEQGSLTTMTLQTKAMKTRKSAGLENRPEPVSKALPYVKRKYGSSNMPNFGPVKRNGVTRRQSWGSQSMKT